MLHLSNKKNILVHIKKYVYKDVFMDCTSLYNACIAIILCIYISILYKTSMEVQSIAHHFLGVMTTY